MSYINYERANYVIIEKPSEDLKAFLDMQSIIKYNSGTEIYFVKGILVKTKDDKWLLFDSEKEYTEYLIINKFIV